MQGKHGNPVIINKRIYEASVTIYEASVTIRTQVVQKEWQA